MNKAIIASGYTDTMATVVQRWMASVHTTVASSLIRACRIMIDDNDPLMVPWTAVGVSHLRMLTSKMVELKYSPNTINHTLSSVKGLIHDLWVAGLVDERTYMLVKAHKSVSGNRVRQGHVMSREEQDKLLSAGQDPRMKAVIWLLLWGLRRVEVTRLDRADVTTKADGSILVKVSGKGNFTRTVPIMGQAAADIMEHVRTVKGGPLFVGHIYGKATGRITPRGLSKLFDQAVADAGLDVKVTTHDGRRTAATELYGGGAGVGSIMAMLGHKRPETTMIYINEAEKENSVYRAASTLADVRRRGES